MRAARRGSSGGRRGPTPWQGAVDWHRREHEAEQAGSAEARPVQSAGKSSTSGASQGFDRVTLHCGRGAVRGSGGRQRPDQHLVRGLLSEPESVAVKVLAVHSLGPEDIREATSARLPEPAETIGDLIPFDTSGSSSNEAPWRRRVVVERVASTWGRSGQDRPRFLSLAVHKRTPLALRSAAGV